MTTPSATSMFLSENPGISGASPISRTTLVIALHPARILRRPPRRQSSVQAWRHREASLILRPGYLPAEDNAKMMKQTGKAPRLVPTRDGRMIDIASAPSVRDLIDAGLMFAGTPDQVYRQIVEFEQASGGFENLLLMLQGGALNHADTVDSLTLFGKEVLPRLREYKSSAWNESPASAAA